MRHYGDGLVDLDDRDSWLTTAGDANIGAPYLLADANGYFSPSA